MLDSKCNPLPVPVEVMKSSNVGSEKTPTTSIDRKSVGTSRVPGSHHAAGAAQKGTRYMLLCLD
jgi:hypothetical protein